MGATFAGILKELDPALHSNLQEIRERAFEDWIHLLKVDLGSHAGYIHLRNVERNADKMIPDGAKKAFGSGEIFILLTTILLHDVGRILVESHPRGTPPPPEARRCPLASGTACPEPDGVHHACMSRHLITTLWPTLGLPDEHMANYCGLLAFWHRLPAPPFNDPPCPQARGTSRSHCDISLDPYGSIRMPLLAAILRIADETENCWTRAVKRHWYDAFVKNDGDASKLKKAFRRGIEDVEFSHRAGCIVMHVPGYDVSDAGALESFLNEIGRTFDKTRQLVAHWGQQLAPAGVAYEFVFIESDGRLLSAPPGDDNRGGDSCLATVLETRNPREVPFLEVGSIERYLDAILRLVRGTRGYCRFPWGAIEGGIGEPLDGRKRWAIEWIGRVDERLRIVPHGDREPVEIVARLESENSVASLRAAITGER
jgi:hypothetical protein